VNKRFRIKSPRVMHETIDGEVILIDLETGTYYSLRDAGAEVWQGVERGASETEIGDALIASYEGPPDEIRAAAAELLAELAREGLVELTGEDGSQSEARAPSVTGGGRVPFRAPVLEKHTDMQDLILLDPVHEVDPRGWPHAAPADASV
jgi:hypothetical protein